jgi:hypothetical protein
MITESNYFTRRKIEWVEAINARNGEKFLAALLAGPDPTPSRKNARALRKNPTAAHKQWDRMNRIAQD